MAEKKDEVYRNRKKMLVDNFLGGVVWSIGVWIGTTIVVALLALILSKINLVPFIGDFVSDIIKHTK